MPTSLISMPTYFNNPLFLTFDIFCLTFEIPLLSLLHQRQLISTISSFFIDGNTHAPPVIMIFFHLSQFDINGKGNSHLCYFSLFYFCAYSWCSHITIYLMNLLLSSPPIDVLMPVVLLSSILYLFPLFSLVYGLWMKMFCCAQSPPFKYTSLYELQRIWWPLSHTDHYLWLQQESCSSSNLISSKQSTIVKSWSLKIVHNPSLIVTQYA